MNGNKKFIDSFKPTNLTYLEGEFAGEAHCTEESDVNGVQDSQYRLPPHC